MSAVSPNDSQYGPARTVARIAGVAKFTLATARVDFADDPFADERVSGRLLHDADKLMADGSFETGVAARDFKVGVADSRKQNAHERFGPGRRLLNLFNRQLLFFDSKGVHKRAGVRIQNSGDRSLKTENRSKNTGSENEPGRRNLLTPEF